ncbi:hypothetical protein [Rugosimonospora africana]|uniref:Uncharacterized protein n=1 Tax=Rugosimonospora africana TaxID=556532 RepID=A0A8J3R4W1_9ACTN|nr:hypothetical protein [Rugosimonospora africana]GIH21365.1 hypothetical protein Raf01_95370 [Rugosimonospora africana]
MPEKRMAAIYEIDGRLLVRTVDSWGGAGIEDKHTDVLDGYPDVMPDELGRIVQAALARCREVQPPSSWPPLRDYARPLLELSPRRYRSYRSWQRAARYAQIAEKAGSMRVERWLPDLGRGAWFPASDDPQDEWTYMTAVPADAGPAVLGAAVLTVLGAPPWQGAPS